LFQILNIYLSIACVKGVQVSSNLNSRFKLVTIVKDILKVIKKEKSLSGLG